MDAVDQLAPGDSMTGDTKAKLSIDGQSHAVNTQLMVTRLSESRLMVQPTHMIMLDASNFGLADGIHKLREIAGLKQISTAVPVDFVFTFTQQQ